MERNNWRDRPQQRDDRSINWDRDESHYRGAYRLDTDSGHRHETTYDGFNRGNQGHHGQAQQGGDYVYRRSRNLQDNDNYTDHQFRHSYDDNRGRGNFEGRDGAYRHDSPPRYESERRQAAERTYYDRNRRSNFEANYGPDRYRHRPGENYGNMAGSLSYGYDGDSISDPDYNRPYNPMTGEMRSYRDNYRNRPQRYGPPDRTGSNPDYDRY
ncbi:hypothetical protein H9Q13_01955 [Pontibacter sp. JH31]|uniref:Uncharacterized protein n=1 Tax=Pontibacter aquaedesilientis TaxID=2766980 RepID=A0ABR7XC94_9BACT|nr:hypothetical protein [Pontibacter aquaedesilientis]MBD1395915.1 hypothetical protein [Pontibacter aquaedesilientis]